MKENRKWEPVTDGDEYYNYWIKAMITSENLSDQPPDIIDEHLLPEQTPHPDFKQEATQPELFHLDPEVSPKTTNSDPDEPKWDPKGRRAPGYGERLGPRRKPGSE